jgi:1-deoxy-D-xylulose-5-phosphate reductoisomerase
MKKRVVLLGSTGSIGLSALKVARDLPDRMEIVGLAANRQADVLLEQAREFKPKAVALYQDGLLDGLKRGLPSGTKCFSGAQGLVDLVTQVEADMVLVAIVGTAGLAPALAAVELGRDLAVASKEILVMAGQVVMPAVDRKGVRLLPVDSEHNAIFQCLVGEEAKHIRRLILTASGGPFRKTAAEDLEKVTLAQALKHPTWKMGQKITIDSATLFNKGLEMIEARWLFHVPMAQVDVVVHPQSIVHSLVEFVDGSQLAQLSHSDMCFPIQYAVTFPDRLPNQLRPLNLAELGSLTFEAPDPVRFPALRLAREAGTTGGTLPAVLNAANEEAVQAFLDEKIAFPEIWRSVERTMKAHPVIANPGLDDIVRADGWARAEARRQLGLESICCPN